MRLPIADGALRSKSELVLRDIRFEVHPGTQFNVILERRDDPTRRARVGTLSFYTPAKAPGTTSRTFDVIAYLYPAPWRTERKLPLETRGVLVHG